MQVSSAATTTTHTKGTSKKKKKKKQNLHIMTQIKIATTAISTTTGSYLAEIPLAQ